MKAKINLLSILFIAILILTSCVKDKDDGVNINSVTQDLNDSEQKVKISSKTLEDYKDIAYKHLEKKEYKKALEYFNIVTEMDPTNFNAYMIVAQIQISQGDYKKGIETYQKVIKTDTEGRASIEAYTMIARTYEDKKQKQLAIEALNDAKKIASEIDPKMVKNLDTKIEKLNKKK